VGLSLVVFLLVGLLCFFGVAALLALVLVVLGRDLHAQGHSLAQAALQAARLRFRPIVMTSLAFILGVVPLALASGAGASSQAAHGFGVFGGLLSATLLGVGFVPVFLVWVVSRFRRRAPPVSHPALPLPATSNE
jgi:multidrug efflux pump